MVRRSAIRLSCSYSYGHLELPITPIPQQSLRPVEIAAMIDLDRVAHFRSHSAAIDAEERMGIGRIALPAQHRRARHRDNRSVVKKEIRKILAAMDAAGLKRFDAIGREP